MEMAPGYVSIAIVYSWRLSSIVERYDRYDTQSRSFQTLVARFINLI